MHHPAAAAAQRLVASSGVGAASGSAPDSRSEGSGARAGGIRSERCTTQLHCTALRLRVPRRLP